MHSYMHACMHSHIHTYIHTCMHVYIHTQVRAHACTHVYTYVCLCAHICVSEDLDDTYRPYSRRGGYSSSKAIDMNNIHQLAIWSLFCVVWCHRKHSRDAELDGRLRCTAAAQVDDVYARHLPQRVRDLPNILSRCNHLRRSFETVRARACAWRGVAWRGVPAGSSGRIRGRASH